MKAKEYLQQVERLEQKIRFKKTEKERWESIAKYGNMHPEGEKVQTSRKQNNMQEAVIMCMNIQEEIDEYIVKFISLAKEVTGVIEQLPTVEYDLLHKLYIGIVETDKQTGEIKTKYMRLREVAESCDKSYTWATTIHSRAIKHVQEILDKN